MIEATRPIGRAGRDRTIAIIPVKELARAKSRLGERLGPEQRADLVLRFLGHVLSALSAAGVEQRVVVSPDPAVREAAARLGAFALDEANGAAVPDGSLAHNRTLERARSWVADREPTSLLVVSADLPLLRPSDVQEILARGADTETVVIAPDRAARGTNALFMRPADAIPFCFGPDSYARHREAASRRGIRVAVYEAVGTAFDVDLPADLDALQLHERGVAATPGRGASQRS